MRSHKRNRQHLSVDYDVRHAPNEVTSDDALRSSFDDHHVKFEVRAFKHDTSDKTKHQKLKSDIGFNIKWSYFRLSSQMHVNSSSLIYQDWVCSQSQTQMNSNTESDEKSFESTWYLWGKAPQRSPAHFISKHESVVAIIMSYLKAWIISGHAGPESTPWSETNKQWLSDRMKEEWRKMTRLLKDHSGCKQLRVNNKPTELKARKVTMHSWLCDILLIALVIWHFWTIPRAFHDLSSNTDVN